MLISLIIASGLMALAARSWLGLSGTVRQSQSRQAREIAEAGIAILIETLNSKYSHLLIKNFSPSAGGNWDNKKYTSSICPESILGEPSTSGIVGDNGKYELIEYDFQGSPFYGGKATIRVKGERILNSSRSGATAIVEQTIEIKPKSCSNSYREETTTSGFPGLLASTITLGNNDVFGKLSGNVLCTNCYEGSNVEDLTRLELLEEIGAQQNNNNCQDPDKPGQGCVAGQIFLGPIDLPGVETAPTTAVTFHIDKDTPTAELTITSDDPRCVKAEGRTHCAISYITLEGAENILSIDTTNGPISLYVTSCDPNKPGCESISLKGGAAIEHLPAASTAADLAIFGRPIDPSNQLTDQEIDIAGASSSNKMWLFFPDGNVGINGGSKGEVNCDPETNECTGGDINGAVWAKTWKGSRSDIAQIVVPADMGTQLFNKFGPKYALGIRDYVALGVSHWSSWSKQ